MFPLVLSYITALSVNGCTYLLLVEFPLNLGIVTGFIDDWSGQLCLDVGQP